MRSLEPLHRLWAGEGGPTPKALGAIASPFAAAFGAGVRIRNLLYEAGVLRVRSAPLPVISVGNLAVGGTGKTPVSAWLVRQLSARGWKPALLTRGYGQDEILLHRRWNPSVPVIRARRRLEGARESAALGRDVVVVDDGFQHRRLKRDVDLVLLSPAHPLPVRLLPRGPFREPLRALHRADVVVVTAKGAHERLPATELAAELRRIPGMVPVELFFLETGSWETLDGDRQAPPAGPPLVVCSIAEPRGFHRSVETRSRQAAELLSFPDHHAYTETEITDLVQQAGSRWIATTEKDAVKLVPFRELLSAVRVLPLVPAASDQLADRLLRPLGAPRPPEELA